MDSANKHLLQKRAELYDLLSRLYEREIDMLLLEHMLSGSQGTEEDCALPLEFVAQAVSRGSEKTSLDLAAEFAALFIGGNRKRRVFPYPLPT
ncbi:MAG: hypothetical protein FWH51_05295 [Dehalococcoidia bacterium]|nr:hypothetical protein [Dehalococcoidia bacterium]